MKKIVIAKPENLTLYLLKIYNTENNLNSVYNQFFLYL